MSLPPASQARANPRSSRPGSGGGQGGQSQKNRRPDPRSKQCPFCDKNALYINYKDYPTLKPYTDYFGNIRNRYYTGVCLKHQKMLKTAMERARFMGMLAYRK